MGQQLTAFFFFPPNLIAWEKSKKMSAAAARVTEMGVLGSNSMHDNNMVSQNV